MEINTTVDVMSIIGNSLSLRGARAVLQRFARCEIPILIHGETGTGKELFARAAHYLSARRDGPLVPVNCGALPDSLLESELFGHRRGAFTDAKSHQPGLVALANGGTLFLDEIDALSPRAQVALLRFLQDQQYRPVGADRLHTADVRVIAATNADLSGLVASGAFRQDLKFRIDVAELRVPPLRERDDDVVVLAEHFLDRLARQYRTAPPRLGAAAREMLFRYSWPGNVRELENVIHRAIILNEDGVITKLPIEQSPQPGRAAGAGLRLWLEQPFECGAGGSLKAAKARYLESFERSYLDKLLRQTGGNVSEAARVAGTERRHLGRMIKRAGLVAAQFRSAESSSSD